MQEFRRSRVQALWVSWGGRDSIRLRALHGLGVWGLQGLLVWDSWDSCIYT